MKLCQKCYLTHQLGREHQNIATHPNENVKSKALWKIRKEAKLVNKALKCNILNYLLYRAVITVSLRNKIILHMYR